MQCQVFLVKNWTKSQFVALHVNKIVLTVTKLELIHGDISVTGKLFSESA